MEKGHTARRWRVSHDIKRDSMGQVLLNTFLSFCFIIPKKCLCKQPGSRWKSFFFYWVSSWS